MKAVTTGTLGLALLVGAGPAVAQQQPQGQAQLEVQEKQPIGQYLTDSQGRSVYLFQADEQGESTCYDACAEAWPPVLSEAAPHAGEGIDPALLGTIEREDGKQQVTYDGKPLYYFVKDQQPGDIAGQDVNGFGAEWYLVTPEGQVARAEGSEEEHARKTKGG